MDGYCAGNQTTTKTKQNKKKQKKKKDTDGVARMRRESDVLGSVVVEEVE